MTPVPVDLAALEDAIISACEKHDRDHKSDYVYTRCVVVEGVFVKYDSYRSMWPQCQTQSYIFECAKLDMNAPRVPEVLHFFHRDYKMAYMLMEYITLAPLPAPDFPKKVAMAVQWLHDLPPPSDRVRVGPLGSGRARHTLFKDYKAPLAFSSIQAIERYLNKCAMRVRVTRRIEPPAPVSISHERLVFTQSDMDASNFGIDEEGRACLFDFTEVGLLPESFAAYTMSLRDPFTVEVAQHLNWPPSPNLETMIQIYRCLVTLADPTLGLDENGFPEAAS